MRPVKQTRSLQLGKVTEVKDIRGKTVLFIDPSKVPSRGAKLSTRLAFAAAFLRRMTEPGSVSPSNTFKLCIRWVEEASREAERYWGR